MDSNCLNQIVTFKNLGSGIHGRNASKDTVSGFCPEPHCHKLDKVHLTKAAGSFQVECKQSPHTWWAVHKICPKEVPWIHRPQIEGAAVLFLFSSFIVSTKCLYQPD
jgi:hypothetical protein